MPLDVQNQSSLPLVHGTAPRWEGPFPSPTAASNSFPPRTDAVGCPCQAFYSLLAAVVAGLARIRLLQLLAIYIDLHLLYCVVTGLDISTLLSSTGMV